MPEPLGFATLLEVCSPVLRPRDRRLPRWDRAIAVLALKARRTQRTELTRAIAAMERQGDRLNGPQLLEEIERRVARWRDLMGRHATQARQLLRKMLRGRPILFEPTEEDGQKGYRFRGEASVSELLAGLVGLPLMVASLTRLNQLDKVGGSWPVAA